MQHANCRKVEFIVSIIHITIMASFFLACRFLPIYFIDFKWMFLFRFCMYIFFFPCRGCEECFEGSVDTKGHDPSCKNIRPGLPPMQQALCVCVSKADPIAAIPSPYPATTPPPHPTHTATLCEVGLCCRYKKRLQVFIWTLSLPQ